jgi:hypothetical protein
LPPSAASRKASKRLSLGSVIRRGLPWSTVLVLRGGRSLRGGRIRGGNELRKYAKDFGKGSSLKTKPLLLDFFFVGRWCGYGLPSGSRGGHQPHSPFEFRQTDALTFSSKERNNNDKRNERR